MSKPIVSILDRKAQVFQGLTPVPSLDVARRWYADLLRDGDSVVTRHPEDFDLYHLGDFDEDQGHIQPLPVPEFVANSEEVQK